MNFRIIVSLSLVLFWPLQARGWGADGHRIIAELAERQLQPRTAAEVRRLLSLEPGATLGSVASWADQVRTEADARWHYVNMPPEVHCHYVAERDCPNGECVVGAIERQLAILKSKAPDDERLRALKYLVHFMGDVHQPLHAGHAADQGGNTFQLQAFGHGTNLHALWDTGLLTNFPHGVGALEQVVANRTTSGAFGNPTQWAEQSCRIVQQAWFYPRTHVLDEEYVTRAKPIVERQLRLAAVRLAVLLDRVLER